MKCRFCGKAMTGRKRRFCDGSCRNGACNAKRKGVAKRECTDCGKPCYGSRCKPCNTVASTKNWCVCNWCGETFKKPNRGGAAGRFCCRKHAYDRQSFATRIVRTQVRFRKLLTAAIREQSKPVPPKRKCECGSTSIRKRMRRCDACSAARAAVSKKRLRRTAKARRRAQKKSVAYETVRPHEVFSRDAYRCGICGKRCHSNACVPHPRAPTLDHIVPLAKGGEHTMRNVQCACFRCNSDKQDKSGSQMRLFG